MHVRHTFFLVKLRMYNVTLAIEPSIIPNEGDAIHAVTSSAPGPPMATLELVDDELLARSLATKLSS